MKNEITSKSSGGVQVRLGIMQPYFFPYLGYFDLIHHTDRWIVFDTAQYIRHGWVNRNRILNLNKEWVYISVPLKKHSRQTAIKDIEISPHSDWKSRIMAQLSDYRKKAPYYPEIIDLVDAALDFNVSHVSRLNVNLLECVCDWIGIDFCYDFYSEMDLNLGPIEGPGSWALRISEAVGAKEYLNPSGGEDLFDSQEFAKSGIKLNIQDFQNFTYNCHPWKFVPGLSIIDVLMWNNPNDILEYLNTSKAT